MGSVIFFFLVYTTILKGLKAATEVKILELEVCFCNLDR